MNDATFDAVLYGPSTPGPGLRVRVRFAAHALHVQQSDAPAQQVPFADVHAQPGGWRGDGLLLQWGAAEARWSLALNDPDDYATLVNEAPAALRSQLQEWRERTRRSNRRLRGWIALVVVAVLSPFVFLGLLLLNADRVVGLAVARLPVEWEVKLGERVAEQTLSTSELLPAGLATQAVDDITQRLLERVDTLYDVRCYVVEEQDANAFALPGGVIVVWTGLLQEAGSADEVAGMLAHEIQHVMHRHSLRALIHRLGLRVALAIVLNGHGSLAEATAVLVDRAAGLRYSREQEMEADRGALEMLQVARIDPSGLARFFERLADTRTELPAFLSTHPVSGERAERLRREMIEETPSTPLPYDWPAILEELSARTATQP